MNPNPSPPAPAADRTRLSLDVPPGVLLLLDHCAEVTGQSRTQLVLTALLEQLPAVVERADALRKRVRELEQASAQARQGGGKR